MIAFILTLTAPLQPVAFGQEPAQKPQSIVAWSVELPAAPMFAPVVDGDRVYLAHLPGVLLAVNLEDGRDLWRADINPDVPPAVDDDRVIVAGGEAIQALRASDGAVLWRTPFAKASARPVVKEGWIVVASAERLQALRAADGSSVWTREVPHLRQPPAIAGNSLIVGTADGWMRAHDLRSGDVIWERRVGGSPSEPVVAGDRVFVGASDKQFYCLDALDGDVEWVFRIGASIPMKAAADDERVYFVALDNLLRAHDVRRGWMVWQQGVPFRPYDGPVVFRDSVLLAGPVPDVRRFTRTGGRMAPLTFPNQLATTPAIVPHEGGLRLVGVTGSFDEPWRLSLVTPATPGTDAATEHR